MAIPSVDEEDERRLSRERQHLVGERAALTNRIGGLLLSQGVRDDTPLHGDRRARLEQCVTGDDRALPPHLRAELRRMLDRLELLLAQIKAVEAEREALIEQRQADSPVAMLVKLRSIGEQSAYDLRTECLFRDYANQRRLAALMAAEPGFKTGTPPAEPTAPDMGSWYSSRRRNRM